MTTTATTTESETLMLDDTFASVWAGCCDHPDDAGRKLIAADRANDLGCENVERGLRFEGGTKWPSYSGWWPRWPGWSIRYQGRTILPYSTEVLDSDVLLDSGTPLDHFERLGEFLKEQGYE